MRPALNARVPAAHKAKKRNPARAYVANQTKLVTIKIIKDEL
jgi:hypothetical protein